MNQNINLSISGLYTSLNDYQGLPPGSLEEANNVEIRYKNVAEPRRGFDQLVDAAVTNKTYKRAINFYVSGTERVIAWNSDGDLVYYTGANPSPTVPGDYSTGLVSPDTTNAKCRFVKAGQNLYVTASDGIRSLSSGTTAETLRAGVPKALDVQADTNGDSSGFLENNVAVTTTGTVTNTSYSITALATTSGIEVGQYVSGTNIPADTTVTAISTSATIIVETGNSTAGSTTISNLASLSGISAGVLISGTGIPSGATVVSTSGAGPYSCVISTAAYQTATGTTFTFSSAVVVTMSAQATGTLAGGTILFYAGSQVGYRVVYGRTEIDINGTTITRLGAASPAAIVYNTLGTDTNCTITAMLPKNAQGMITFVRLYRSPQTASTEISPLDQYALVYETELDNSHFTARVITITDDVSDSLVGLALYSGSDQEGALQENSPPPMSWDMCKFRDMVLYGNITRPTSKKVTVTAVGAPSGIQVNDTITIAGTFGGVAFSRVYTAKAAETAASREFKVFTTGTASQNITDTVNSLIHVVNYDENCPVHCILLSSTTDLPGQILFEADYPSGSDTFTMTASAHTSAYDPALSSLESTVNKLGNAVGASKLGEYEAVPATNLNYAGETSSDIYRMIPLRDYVVVIKSDGIYKTQGYTPQTLTITAFDLTTKIIGAETAVPLNSAVWMFSNQGVVSISDGGVEAKSFQVDDQLNTLIGSYLDNVTDVAFAVGYESDRKYILSLPSSSDAWCDTQYGFNYVTSAWTNWDRNLYYGFIHSNDGKMYILRADPVSGADTEARGISKERKTGTYSDYVDESFDVTITAVNGDQITLNDVDQVSVGDVLYQTANLFSPISAIDVATNVVTVQYELSFTVAAASILRSFTCTVTWKQVFGDNPAFMRQYPEGALLFKNTRFQTATLTFSTDFSQVPESVSLTGSGIGLWGLFEWGNVPWGGSVLPSKIRFLVPQGKQLGSYLIPSISIANGYSDFKLQGLVLAYDPLSLEVGL